MIKACCLRLLAAFAIWAAVPICAQDKYEVLAKVLQPYGALFYSKSAIKAVDAEVIPREGPIAFLNQKVRIALQLPDKLRLESLDPEKQAVLCRSGQRVWVYPKSLAADVMVSRTSKGKIPDFRLPFKDQEIVMLPALFQILGFRAQTDPDGDSLWVMELRLAPEIVDALNAGPWTATVTVRQNNYQVRRIQISSDTWTGSLELAKASFSRELPAQTWQPGAAYTEGATFVQPDLFAPVLAKLTGLDLFQ
ncbi:MAG: hypothetical protein JOY96_02270 [Verrucomicrobia bacterium]|nr:hypothetical protein [Verrucomicrobiota bacterium]